MNKANLVGRLTKDPDLRFGAGSGTAVTKFTLAINRRFKKEGQPEADFIPIVCFGKQAEAVANYSAKGKLVSVVGNIQTSNYEKDGNRIYKTEIIADEVNFLEWASKGEDSKSTSSNDNNSFSPNSDITPIDDGDIPF